MRFFTSFMFGVTGTRKAKKKLNSASYHYAISIVLYVTKKNNNSLVCGPIDFVWGPNIRENRIMHLMGGTWSNHSLIAATEKTRRREKSSNKYSVIFFYSDAETNRIDKQHWLLAATNLEQHRGAYFKDTLHGSSIYCW